MDSLGPVFKVDTILNADCVAWCPHPDKSNLLLCSTYQLVGQKRTGSLLLFSVDPEPRLLQSVVNLQGVFDFNWSPPEQDTIRVALADSDGQICLLQLDLNDDLLNYVSTFKASEAMALYVDWMGTNLAVSFSDGSVSILEIGSEGLRCVQTMKYHSLEAWATVFDKNDPALLYSGGDDCLMAVHDLRSQSLSSKNRYHSAGVTHFATCKQRPDHLMSGSYDELICLWDKRKLRNPLNELGLGGGVWRIESENKETEPRLAVACMFRGFKFLENGAQGLKEVGGFRNEEDCLAYGVGLSLDNRAAMCTFYDHSLQISRVSPFVNE